MAEGTTAPGMSETTNECSQIKDLMDQPLSDGDTWYGIMSSGKIVLHLLNHIYLHCRYLIDLHWFNLWKKYVGWDTWDSSNVGDPTCHPGNIDNSVLLKGD